jgi:DNA (cytosine-5)-methyltransferase 1
MARGYTEQMASLFSRKLDIQQSTRFNRSASRICQTLTIGEGRYTTTCEAPAKGAKDAEIAWVQAFLTGRSATFPPAERQIRMADLFCAAGGLTTGVRSAARSLGIESEVALAVDGDLQALEIYQHNHGPWLASGTDVQSMVNFKVDGRGDDARWGTWPALIEPHMAGYLANLDLLCAGPPCQGHSNLNNKTRRNDSRNLLYLTTVAFVVAVGARVCIIENVPEVLNDSNDVVRTARALLLKSGYRLDDKVLSADSFGVPQRRRRHFLVGIRNYAHEFDLVELLRPFEMQGLTVRQGIGDLICIESSSPFDSNGKLSNDNVRRIDWLFENNAFDLIDKERPDCHQNGHTYPSNYGRIRWDAPAQTITTGFLSPGRGRFIHPSQRRTITPHEAARLQGFPDSYMFEAAGHPSTRSLLSKVIGDAVPPLLARAVALGALSLDLLNDKSGSAVEKKR